MPNICWRTGVSTRKRLCKREAKTVHGVVETNKKGALNFNEEMKSSASLRHYLRGINFLV